MGNMFLSRIDTVRDLSRFQIHNIKADVIPEAHIGDAVTAIHGVGEYPAFAYVLDLADHLLIARIKYRQHGLAAKVQEPSIQADEGVVGRGTDHDPFDQLAGIPIEDQHSTIGCQVPVSGRNVDLLAIQSNGRSIGARFVSLIPDDLFRFQIEGAHAAIAGGEVGTVGLEVSGETAKAFLKRGDIDAPHELVPLIDIENQNALAGPVISLSCIGRADVQIPFGGRLARGESGD